MVRCLPGNRCSHQSRRGVHGNRARCLDRWQWASLPPGDAPSTWLGEPGGSIRTAVHCLWSEIQSPPMTRPSASMAKGR